MTRSDLTGIDTTSPPFDRLRNVHRLGANRSGRTATEYSRHQLYAGRDRETAANVLVKVTSKPGVVYEYNLANEIASLTTINRELPDSRSFPLLFDHGRLPDGRLYMVASLFDELPLATSIGTERLRARLVGHVRTAMAVSLALTDLHGIEIFHVDLNPMNILFRMEKGAPVIRIVDFESSYEKSRHGAGEFYDPPTTPGYSAPEITTRPPDARSDVYSLGAVLYTMIVSYGSPWIGELRPRIEADGGLDSDLRELLLTAVALDPDDRYPSMPAFHSALDGYLERIWPGRSGTVSQ